MRYLSFVLIFISVSPFSVFAEEMDSIPNKTAQTASLPDSVLYLLKESDRKLDSLINENSALKGLLKDSQNESGIKDREIINLQRKIDDLQNTTIKRLEASNDTLQRRLISMASNFLYIPYNEYSIEEIALPAFISTKGTPAYTRYQNRFPLLQNYKDDVSNLIDYLIKAEKDLSIPLAKMIEIKSSEYQKKLSELPLYIRYTSYDDWMNTYIGLQIRTIQGYLDSPSKETSSRLKSLRNKLEKLLTDI